MSQFGKSIQAFMYTNIGIYTTNACQVQNNLADVYCFLLYVSVVVRKQRDKVVCLCTTNKLTVPRSGEIYWWRLNKFARWKNFNILCIGFNETDTTHTIAASCRTPYAAERERG